MKNLLELKEWAELKESVLVKRIQDIHRGEKLNQKMRESKVSMLYNPSYCEEKERYLINLNALKAHYSFGQIR